MERCRPKSVQDIKAKTRQSDAAAPAVLLAPLYGQDDNGIGDRATCSAQIICQRVMQRNTPYERGIGVVRDKIKPFAESGRISGSWDGLKIVTLDEADAMTSTASLYW